MNAATVLLILAATFPPLSSPATTNNDDSCDVGHYPAATLLLPYFEVDLDSRAGDGETTIFTVTNVGAQPQAARVTLWTGWAYPIISFNLYLTGYDVQSINLYDVIRRGQLAPDTNIGSTTSPIGELSETTNPRLEEDTCTTSSLPRVLPQVILSRMQSAFTTGKVPQLGSAPACNAAGEVHRNAAGYLTIDVVGVCTGTMPTEPSYFTHEIRYDNVLMGDYVQVNGNEDFAQGNPMVHIRAIPEGGTLATRRKTNLAHTFYSRLQPAVNQTSDARQPLPSTFAARWISGGATGFETFFKIWREAPNAPDAGCAFYPRNALLAYEVVRFDEEENPETFSPDIVVLPIAFDPTLPNSSLTDVTDESLYPTNTQDAVAGWMYMNLSSTATAKPFATQNWITISMRAEDRFSADFDASALGNGCSPITPKSEAYAVGGVVIGPAPNAN
jgi:hypothetical protein